MEEHLHHGDISSSLCDNLLVYVHNCLELVDQMKRSGLQVRKLLFVINLFLIIFFNIPHCKNNWLHFIRPVTFHSYLFCCCLQGGNTDPRVQAVSENCKDVQILCQHTNSLYKGNEIIISKQNCQIYPGGYEWTDTQAHNLTENTNWASVDFTSKGEKAARSLFNCISSHRIPTCLLLHASYI